MNSALKDVMRGADVKGMAAPQPAPLALMQPKIVPREEVLCWGAPLWRLPSTPAYTPCPRVPPPHPRQGGAAWRGGHAGDWAMEIVPGDILEVFRSDR